MRTSLRALICALVSIGFGGCAFFPDFATSPVYHLPISEVVNQIRCDMHRFLVSAPDDRNFSLDKNSYATVELALSTTAYGDVKFSRIDTVRLGARGFLAVGGGSEPFPSLGTKVSGQTVAKVQVNISQNPELLADACSYGYGEILSAEPHADKVLINQMRVAEWLKRSFDRGERIKSEGASCDTRSKKGGDGGKPCSVSLELATLSTKFQLVADVSGGMLDFAKLIPVVATPTLALGTDYYHQVTIIFSGNNAIDTKARAGEKLAQRDGYIYSPPVRYEYQRRSYDEKRYKEDDQSPEAEKWRRDKRDREERDRLRRLERLERRLDQTPTRSSEEDSAAILRQLRSIRDATILNAPR